MAGLASLGVAAHYVGRVRDDQLGRVFAHDIRTIGVGYTQPLAEEGPATGCCLVFVTPDAQRTMNTFLGASALLGPADIDRELVASAEIVYLEGYLFDRPEAQEAFRAAASTAHDAGRRVALTLSDTFCVERHRDAFTSLVEDHVDVLFANEAEILSLYQLDDVEEAAAISAKSTPIVVVTMSERGAIVLADGRRAAVPAEPVEEVVDTTGAGDQFAAGFLAGLAGGQPLDRCARMGAIAAAEVISHIGPRPQTDLRRLVDERLGGT
jgi:sugar/nucleoside kinase (ribokinase family)